MTTAIKDLYSYPIHNRVDGLPPWRFEINVPEVEDRSARIESVVRLLADEVYNDMGFTRPPLVDNVMTIKPPTPQF